VPDINPQTIRKIAVLRANALGDFIFVLPALRAIGQTFPQAEVVYLGKQWHAGFIPGHVPEVDRIIVVPSCPGVGGAEGTIVDGDELNAFFYSMQKEQFDIAFQMHGGGGNSNPFVKRLGAKLTIGTTASNAEPLDMNVGFAFYQNEILRYLELAALAGARTDNIVPQLQVTTKDIHESTQVKEQYNLQNPYIVLHPGATDPRRRWPAENFSSVARHFINQGYSVMVTGTPNESNVVEEVCKDAPGAIDMTGKLSLGGLTGLLAEAAMVISNDTGPLHVAAAVGAKTIGIYWVGNLISAGHMTRANDRPLVSWTIDCPACGISCVQELPFDKLSCNHQVSFVNDVTVDQVITAAKELSV
jgi:ADP-heptose:LPS heptosyltransferase